MEKIEPEIIETLVGRYGVGSVVEPSDDAQMLRVQSPEGRRISYAVRRSHTGPEAQRELALARSGIFRSLPSGAAAPDSLIVALADGEALLIQQPLLTLAQSGLTTNAALCVARAIAGLHSTFVGFPARLTASLGLEAPGLWLRGDPLAPNVAEGWAVLAALLPDEWARVDHLRQQSAPLVDALRQIPATIAQGAPTLDQMALDAGTVTFLNWGQSLRAPGTVDLGVFLATGWSSLPVDAAEVIEAYRSERERLGRLSSEGEGWERELALGLLAGFIRYGWKIGNQAPDPSTVRFWAVVVDRARMHLGRE